ncbi:hypothetical protein E3N88_42003 [Mikania micrantha]|uniref:Uncharacterized protein n=1 Tax=Mikania micrantha TaxID=192012 RepID=A0A5N6LIZ6_9ASTR|nr:hypothetical protein E3N88_42003 [Mikania micrantha]
MVPMYSIRVVKVENARVGVQSLVCELKDVLAGSDWMSKIIPGDEAVVECQVVEEVELCGTLKDVAIAAGKAKKLSARKAWQAKKGEAI